MSDYAVCVALKPTVAERLTRLLRESGLQQKAVAHRAGLNPESINRIIRGGTVDPQWSTMVKLLSNGFGVSLDEFEGGRPKPRVTPYDANSSYRSLIDALETVDEGDRSEIIDHALWAAQRARPRVMSTNLVLFPVPEDDEGDFPPPPIAPGEWIDKDTDAPRALHAWVVPIDHEAAAGNPRMEDDWLIPTTQLLNSVREIRDDRTKVVKVFGSSMHPILRDGWKVLLDPARSLFQPGKIVVVYIRDEGSTMGLLASQGERFWIQKRNPDYGGPMQITLNAGEWYPVGTVTKIVEASVEIE